MRSHEAARKPPLCDRNLSAILAFAVAAHGLAGATTTNRVRYPSGQRGLTVNQLAYAFGGSNPSLTTSRFPSCSKENGKATGISPVAFHSSDTQPDAHGRGRRGRLWPRRGQRGYPGPDAGRD